MLPTCSSSATSAMLLLLLLLLWLVEKKRAPTKLSPPISQLTIHISSYLHIYGAIKVNNPLITYNSPPPTSCASADLLYRDLAANRCFSPMGWLAPPSSCALGRNHFSLVQIANRDNNACLPAFYRWTDERASWLDGLKAAVKVRVGVRVVVGRGRVSKGRKFIMRTFKWSLFIPIESQPSNEDYLLHKWSSKQRKLFHL